MIVRMKLVIAGLVALGLAGATATGLALSQQDQSIVWTTATVEHWVDGDTVKTSASPYNIRLIGVDTPEKGQCGSDKATELANLLAPAGSKIQLGDPESVRDTDKYGRLLRYVEVPNKPRVDVGFEQIKAGALARYDSRDGYDWHPRESSYHGLDLMEKDYSKQKLCVVVLPADEDHSTHEHDEPNHLPSVFKKWWDERKVGKARRAAEKQAAPAAPKPAPKPAPKKVAPNRDAQPERRDGRFTPHDKSLCLYTGKVSGKIIYQWVDYCAYKHDSGINITVKPLHSKYCKDSSAVFVVECKDLANTWQGWDHFVRTTNERPKPMREPRSSSSSDGGYLGGAGGDGDGRDCHGRFCTT